MIKIFTHIFIYYLYIFGGGGVDGPTQQRSAASTEGLLVFFVRKCGRCILIEHLAAIKAVVDGRFAIVGEVILATVALGMRAGRLNLARLLHSVQPHLVGQRLGNHPVQILVRLSEEEDRRVDRRQSATKLKLEVTKRCRKKSKTTAGGNRFLRPTYW